MTRIRPILVIIAAVLVLIACWIPTANALVPAGGGFFWQSPQPIGASGNIYELTFADADHLWGITWGGQGDLLVYSDDGGLTWTTVDPGIEGELYGLTFPEAQHGRLFASWWDAQTKTTHAALVYTDNGGTSWASRPLPDRFDPYDAAFATAQKGWIVGYSGDQASRQSAAVRSSPPATPVRRGSSPCCPAARLTRSGRSMPSTCGYNPAITACSCRLTAAPDGRCISCRRACASTSFAPSMLRAPGRWSNDVCGHTP